MNTYDTYKTVNRSLAKGEAIDGLPAGSVPRFLSENGWEKHPRFYPKIGVYAGVGTSHSWLWFVDIFEKMGFWELRFIDEFDVQSGVLDTVDVFAVSGGDTFAIAEGLGKEGAERIAAFVAKGGVYIGSCAGAYLPMKSSKSPLNLFNFAEVKITNLSKILPKAVALSHKYCTTYGCDFIFHPVREKVKIRSCNLPPFASDHIIEAPLYGGPGMIAGENSEILAVYEDFTDKTQLLVDRQLAEETLIGRAAAVRTQWDKGRFYLFGPHFEHPQYPEANKMIADTIYLSASPVNHETVPAIEQLSGGTAKTFIRDIKRELSNARIVALNIEFLPIRWQIGKKVYEPEKFRVFIEAMWKRLQRLEKEKTIIVSSAADPLIEDARNLTKLMREIKHHIDKKKDSFNIAAATVDALHRVSKAFMEIYFLNLNRDHLTGTRKSGGLNIKAAHHLIQTIKGEK